MLEGEFEDTVDAIRTMRIRGAGAIARAAARAMAAAVREGRDIEAARRTLLNTRPSAVSLRNAVEFMYQRATAAGEDPDAVDSAAAEFEAYAAEARAGVVRHGSRLMVDFGRYLTHCNSSAVIDTLVAARRSGRRFEVFATETRPWGQGHLTVQALASAGIETTLIVDSAARHIIATEDIHAVLLGADTVTMAGSLINKVGTASVASAARDHGVPVYVFTETYKFSPAAMGRNPVPIEERPAEEVLPCPIPGVKVRNPVFDVTPPEMVKGIVTEGGIITPSQARAICERIGAGDLSPHVA
ncbi:MAG: S-methyl-5-thioribose-1-phosphate isomerase [Thermoplasmata archaeon]|nr:S-methyl-5-thioribose-1-phosphate isomerase [Thermoplasmata archaeon]